MVALVPTKGVVGLLQGCQVKIHYTYGLSPLCQSLTKAKPDVNVGQHFYPAYSDVINM